MAGSVDLRRTVLKIAVAVVMICAERDGARAAEVSFSISSHETFVGAPITIEVRIENAETHDPPEFPEVDGADVDGPRVSQQSYTSITSRGTVVRTTYVYTYHVIPRRAGELTIPSIHVIADGEPSQTNPTQVTVKKSDAGDLLFVELVADRQSVYVGEEIDVTLEIWLQPFEVGRVRLDYNDMWRRINVQHSTWGPFQEIVIKSRNVQVRQSSRRDAEGSAHDYYVFFLRRTLWAERPGAFDTGGLAILVDYPLQIRRNRFSLLGPKYQVTESRPVSATLGNSNIIIKPLPLEDKPDIFRGAVGRYTMKVRATPTKASVGDPITITMAIRGNGRLDVLQAPPLVTQEILTADFRVPDEKLAGVVENGVKTFTQSIRAKRDDITEIPPIAFAYFDPTSEHYVTITSDAIPIAIKQSTRMAVSQMAETAGMFEPATTLTLMTEGLMANYDDIDALLATEHVSLGWGAMGMAAGWPVVYALCLLFRRQHDRLQFNTGLARRRGARRNAIAAIGKCDRASNDTNAASGSIASAVTQYIADRCDLPAGGVTRGDAMAQLRRRGMPEDVIGHVDALLAECESAQYAGTEQTTRNDLVGRARHCIDELERHKL